MVETKDKIVTTESLSALHEHNKETYETKENVETLIKEAGNIKLLYEEPIGSNWIAGQSRSIPNFKDYSLFVIYLDNDYNEPIITVKNGNYLRGQSHYYAGDYIRESFITMSFSQYNSDVTYDKQCNRDYNCADNTFTFMKLDGNNSIRAIYAIGKQEWV